MNLLIGRLHPLLVHLPIGILLIALFFEWLSRKERFMILKSAVRVSLFCGAVVAILSCVSGYLLSTQNDYQDDVLNWHLASGIATAAISIGLYFLFLQTAAWSRKVYSAGCVLLFFVISLTGHLGGNLTHGSTYLTDALPSPIRAWFTGEEDKQAEIVNIQDARVYDDLVKPIFDEKCKSCHGETKQRGGLRLDMREAIVKGGKKGKTLVAGKPFNSEMIKRIYLPMNHEDHMPPKGKSQVTAAEVQILKWWIKEGALFDKKVGELSQPETIKPILEGLQSSDPAKTIFANKDLPETPAEKIADTLLTSLRSRNITVVSEIRGSNYLLVSFLALPKATDETIQSLLPLRKNLLELKLGNTKITDNAMKVVGQCVNLVRLGLERTALTDAGIVQLKELKDLQYLNLVETQVTAKGLIELQPLRKLKRIYLYRTAVEEKDWPMLKDKFPTVVLDRGGYQVPTTTEDTTLVKVRKQ